MTLLSALVFQSIHFNLKKYGDKDKKIRHYDIFLDVVNKKLLNLIICYKDGNKKDITELYHKDFEIDVEKFEQLFNDNIKKKGIEIKKFVLLSIQPTKCLLATGDNGKELKKYEL